MFGAKPAEAEVKVDKVEDKPAGASTDLLGKPAENGGGMFGGAKPAEASKSMFGGKPLEVSGGNLFGAAKTDSKPAATGGSLFGGSKPADN